MKKMILSFLLTLSIITLHAQQEQYDLCSFQVPVSWKKEQKEGFMSYSSTSGSAYCLIAVYKTKAAGKDAVAEFNASWKEQITTSFGLAKPATVTKEVRSGWTIQSGSATGTNTAGAFAVMLYTQTGFGRHAAAVIIYNADTYRDALTAFISGFKAYKDAASMPKANTTPVPPASNTQTPVQGTLLKGGGPVGVWMGFEPGGMSYGVVRHDYVFNTNEYGLKYDVNHLELKFRVFMSNGWYYDGLPFQGLYNYDPKDPKNDESGSYKTDSWLIKAKLDHYSTERLFSLKAPGDLKAADKYQYIRCRPVDGLKLNGTYISADPVSASYYKSIGRPDPTIVFTTDGQFADVNFIDDYANDPATAAGYGTYEIRDFTLILHYTDGRTIRRSFTAFLNDDPATTKKYFIAGRDVKLKTN